MRTQSSLQKSIIACVLVTLAFGASPTCIASDWMENDRDHEVQEQSADGTVTATVGSDAPLVSTPAPDELLVRCDKLEAVVFGCIRPQLELVDRLGILEKAVFGKAKSSRYSHLERVEDLELAVAQPDSPNAAASMKSGNSKLDWFFDPPPIPMLDGIGRGLKTGGKTVMAIPRSAVNVVDSTARSPLFWQAVAGAGAVVGGYYLLKGTQRRHTGYGGTGSNPGYHLRRRKDGGFDFVTNPNATKLDNFSTFGNINPLGQVGTRWVDY